MNGADLTSGSVVESGAGGGGGVHHKLAEVWRFGGLRKVTEGDLVRRSGGWIRG